MCVSGGGGVRIALVILCSSWHMGPPPKAMKYITCGVIPFRPWHASWGPLVRLSAAAAASLSSVPFPPRLRPLLLLFCSTRLPQFQPLGFGLYCHLLSSLPSLPRVIAYTLLPPPLHGRHLRLGVPGSAAADRGAMIQKPHINTGISPRDYLSVACLPGRVLLCNLCSTVNRAGLGERGFAGVEG